MSEHLGVLAFLSEASEIQQELGVSVDRAFQIQRERSAERLREYAAIEQAAAESNVIPLRAKH